MIDALRALKEEIARLEKWKAEALIVSQGVQFQAIAKALDLPLGKDIGPLILPGILDLKQRLAAATETKGRSEVPYVLRLLVAVARAAHQACDNAEQGTFKTSPIKVDPDDFATLSAALDALDALSDPPGEAATGPRKAEHYLQQCGLT